MLRDDCCPFTHNRYQLNNNTDTVRRDRACLSSTSSQSNAFSNENVNEKWFSDHVRFQMIWQPPWRITDTGERTGRHHSTHPHRHFLQHIHFSFSSLRPGRMGGFVLRGNENTFISLRRDLMTALATPSTPCPMRAHRMCAKPSFVPSAQLLSPPSPMPIAFRTGPLTWQANEMELGGTWWR